MRFSWYAAKQWVLPKLIIAVLALLIVFVVVQSFLLWYKSYQTNQQVGGLKKELVRLEEQHARLDSFRKFLESDFFAEQEARVKLGMQKKGERVVVVPQKDSSVSENGVSPSADSGEGQQASGIQRDEPPDTSDASANNRWSWWSYFFDKF